MLLASSGRFWSREDWEGPARRSCCRISKARARTWNSSIPNSCRWIPISYQDSLPRAFKRNVGRAWRSGGLAIISISSFFILYTVDYILFLTADVDVTPNLNEIRDYKYVSKEELQAMFEDPSKSQRIFIKEQNWLVFECNQATALLHGSSSSRETSYSVGGTNFTSERMRMARLSPKA